MLVCVLHGGLNPVLIMAAKPKNEMFEYLVDHAFGGFYRNQTTTLNDLVQSRSEEGWQVCGTFEDVFLWPSYSAVTTGGNRRRLPASATEPVLPEKLAEAPVFEVCSSR